MGSIDRAIPCLILLFILGIMGTKAGAAQGRNYADTLTGVELIRNIKSSKDSTYERRNCLLTRSSWEAVKALNRDSLTIEKSVSLKDFEYDSKSWLKFRNITFKEEVKLENVDPFLWFKDCFFQDHLIWAGSDLPMARFDGCVFKKIVWFADCKGQLYFHSCEFVPDLTEDERDQYLKEGRKNWRQLVTIFSPWETFEFVSMVDCSFRSGKPPDAVTLRGNYGEVYIRNSSFEPILSFHGAVIENDLGIENSVFQRPIDVKGMSLPKLKNIHIKWDQIDSGRIAIYDRYETPYLAKGDSQLCDTITKNAYHYFNLISIYSKLHQSYQIHGARESANACYIEKKTIQARKLHYDYQQHPTLDNFFRLRLNQFLGFFCAYGTSPQRALIISMWVVLGFSAFYFFFYSQWDGINRSLLIAQYSKLQEYFTTDRRLTDLYLEGKADDLRDFDDLKKRIEAKEAETPYLFRMLGKPLYQASILRHRFIEWFYQRVEIMGGRWKDLNRPQKGKVGTLLGLAILFYLLYLVLVRAFNALVLSINTFSTLGFGVIPVKGFLRYIAVAEGFLGWFLLSIFSVTLINQLLQF